LGHDLNDGIAFFACCGRALLLTLLSAGVFKMQKRALLSVGAHIMSLCAVVLFCAVFSVGQTTASGSKTERQSKHYDVEPSDETRTQDQVEAKLTPGQKKAVASAKSLRPGSLAVFKPDGSLIEKGPLTEFVDRALKACKDLRPISDRCWLCKDDNKIFCANSGKQRSLPEPMPMENRHE
jgi:hypothetical protein